MDGEQKRMLERWHQINHRIRQRCRVGEQCECHTVGDGAERWQALLAIKDDCCSADTEGKRDRELVKIPPRPASYNDGACDERNAERSSRNDCERTCDRADRARRFGGGRRATIKLLGEVAAHGGCGSRESWRNGAVALGYEDKVYDIEGECADEGDRPNDNEIEGECRHLGASRAARRRSSGALYGDQRSGAKLKAAGVADAALRHSNREAAGAGDQERLAAERAGAPIWIDRRLTSGVRAPGGEVRPPIGTERGGGGEGRTDLQLRTTLGDADQRPDATRGEEPEQNKRSDKEGEETDQRRPVGGDKGGDDRAQPGEEPGNRCGNFTHGLILAGARRTR